MILSWYSKNGSKTRQKSISEVIRKSQKNHQIKRFYLRTHRTMKRVAKRTAKRARRAGNRQTWRMHHRNKHPVKCQDKCQRDNQNQNKRKIKQHQRYTYSLPFWDSTRMGKNRNCSRLIISFINNRSSKLGYKLISVFEIVEI